MHTDRSIEQEQADQVRRTTGATLAARALEEVLPAIGKGYAPQAHRKAAERMSKDIDKPGFTLGPSSWRPANYNGDTYIENADGENVCLVLGDQRDPDVRGATKVIAAAPDLLAACEYALQYTIANGDAHDRIRAALAAARGE